LPPICTEARLEAVAAAQPVRHRNMASGEEAEGEQGRRREAE
jgi:hypothetical protein